MNSGIASGLTQALTIAGVTVSQAATIAGNAVECATNNEMVQTAGKILQSVSTAFIALMAMGETLTMAQALGQNTIFYIAAGVGGLVLILPLIFPLAKNLFPGSKEKIECFQKKHSVALKIVNIATAGMGLGFCLLSGPGLAVPIGLYSVSLISSGYALYKNSQPTVTSENV